MADDFAPIVDAAAARYGVDPAIAHALLAQESGGRARAVSGAGASGLMQLMPATAAMYGVRGSQIFDPAANIDAGVHYFSDMQHRFGSIPEALVAYNAGPGWASRLHSGRISFGQLPSETQNYVPSVLHRSGGIFASTHNTPTIASEPDVALAPPPARTASATPSLFAPLAVAPVVPSRPQTGYSPLDFSSTNTEAGVYNRGANQYPSADGTTRSADFSPFYASIPRSMDARAAVQHWFNNLLRG